MHFWIEYNVFHNNYTDITSESQLQPKNNDALCWQFLEVGKSVIDNIYPFFSIERSVKVEKCSN